ncbi:MAG: hypothetical protein KA368_11715 [Acidobacteria bacterium]|nr:hypothetical protein [Acidobacteriota bacterium]
MATNKELEAKISTYKWRDLVGLWNKMNSGTEVDWKPGKALEYLVLRAFQLEGAEVQWPYQVNVSGETIEQIDGVVYSDNLCCLIECKDLAEPVNIEPIAKPRNQLLRRPAATIGVIFSRTGFTTSAVTLAQFLAPQTILLWEGIEIEYALKKRVFRRSLDEKYRFCVENGFPNYNIKQGESL